MYLRVAVDDGRALDAQRAMLSRHLAARGWRADWVYVDVGDGGSAAERPALQRLLERVAVQGVDAVAVTDLDRLTRHAAWMLALSRDLVAAGVALYSAAQPDVDQAPRIVAALTSAPTPAAGWAGRQRRLPVAGRREWSESR
jgi:DNA invertase Pin-like site-specific DNA recombinase